LLLIPVLRDGSGNYLWNDPNPWRAAWARSPERGLVPFIIPDAADAGLTPEQALGKDNAAINALTARYDVGGALIAVATTAGESAQLVLTELRRGFPADETLLTYTAAPGQSRDEMFASAAQIASQSVQESWRKRNRVTSGAMAQLTVLVPIEDLKEWMAVKNRLGDVSLVDHIDLQALTRDRAQVTLTYAGEQSQLALAMAQQDLALAQQNGVWLIELLRGGKASGRVLGRPGTGAGTGAAAPQP
jgi:hypothetical protein